MSSELVYENLDLVVHGYVRYRGELLLGHDSPRWVVGVADSFELSPGTDELLQLLGVEGVPVTYLELPVD